MKDAKVLKCDIDHSPMDMVTKIMMHFLIIIIDGWNKFDKPEREYSITF